MIGTLMAPTNADQRAGAITFLRVIKRRASATANVKKPWDPGRTEAWRPTTQYGLQQVGRPQKAPSRARDPASSACPVGASARHHERKSRAEHQTEQ